MMNSKNFLVVLASLMTFSLVANLGLAQVHRDGSVNVVYRGTNGELTKDSQINAKVLMKKATSQGAVALWLTLNIPYETDMSSMSPAEIAEQEKAVRRGFAKVLNPLVAKDVVAHQNRDPFIAGNGCRVLATAAGVRALVADQRILHIIETRDQRTR